MAKADPRYAGNEDKRIFKEGGWLVFEDVGFLSGGQSTSDDVVSHQADTKFWQNYVESDATSGDARALYLRMTLSGAGTGGGETGRFYTVVGAALTTGGVHGVHSTLELAAAGSEAGLSAGVRATLAAAAATKTLTGTYCSLQVDSDIATGNTVDGQKVSFIRVADNGAVKMPYLFDFSSLTAADTEATIQADSGAVSTIYGYARVLCPGGAVGYLVIYAAHS